MNRSRLNLLVASGSFAAISIASISIASGAFAGSIPLTVDGDQSSASTALHFAADIVGTFKGDFDARTNPGGTQTRPGLFGGSGNNAIPYSAVVELADSTTTAPSGSLAVDFDLLGATVTIDGLILDLLGGASANVEASFTISYSTFNTINPSGIFPSVGPLTFPLGEVATITMLTATQTMPTVGTLSGGGGDVYDVVALVPVDVLVDGDVFGTPLGDGTPLPLVLAISGTLDLSVAGVAKLTIAGTQSISDGGPVSLPFENVPFGLPTIFGEYAYQLLSGEITEIEVLVDIDFTIVATGEFDPCAPADLNCDGVVDGADLGLLLSAWGAKGSDADLNADGVVDGADLGILLAAWSTG